MVQTDRPVPPASSGGALLDADGSVVGIANSHPIGDAGAFGFATPIDGVVSVADQLITSGRVVGVWLGIQGTDADGVTATKLDVDGGAVVGEVTSGSPAERGGLLSRDVIVAHRRCRRSRRWATWWSPSGATDPATLSRSTSCGAPNGCPCR